MSFLFPAMESSPLALPLTQIDARAKLAGLMVYLIAVATTPARGSGKAFVGYALVLFVPLAASRLPVAMILLRAAAVIPFCASFALLTWWSAGAALALVIIEKSFLSALAAVMVMAGTPLPEMARALRWFKMPAMLVLVLQFLYRYLWVTAGQARRMQMAARSRAGLGSRSGFRSAAGSLGVLFARSSERAEGIHHAMLSRGFTGTFPALVPSRFTTKDAAFLAVLLALILAAALAARF